jgi:hypothetical protein
MSVFVSLVIHVRGIREVLDSRGTVQAVRDPHDTEGVRCTYIGHDGIVLGVTPPGTLRKMNQDNDCLFNANLKNELMYDHACYDYARRIPCTIMSKNKSIRCYKTSTSYD